jgi:rhodanese-related sulfurtransferase
MSVSKRTSIVVLSVVAILAVVVAFNTQDLFRSDNYGDVSVNAAWDLIQNEPEMVILDVRTPSEYDDAHIEGAINIPVEEIVDRHNELSANDVILVYCRTGNRSGTAVGIMEENGFSKIYHMYEGISTWISEGLPVV